MTRLPGEPTCGQQLCGLYVCGHVKRVGWVGTKVEKQSRVFVQIHQPVFCQSTRSATANQFRPEEDESSISPDVETKCKVEEEPSYT